MKTLMKILVGLFIITATATANCDEQPAPEVKNDYNYWAIGVGIPSFLSAKVGRRFQTGHHGYEYGVGLTPLVVVMEGHVFGSYLYYPKPSLISQSYIGLGLRAGGILDHKAKFGYIAPGLILGREYLSKQKTKRFIQIAVGPGGLTTDGFKSWGSVSLAFGYGF